MTPRDDSAILGHAYRIEAPTLNRRILLFAELIVLYGIVPLALCLGHVARGGVYAVLSSVCLYAGFVWWRSGAFSWKNLVWGHGWLRVERWRSATLFLLSLPLIYGLTIWLVPDKLLRFPIERPALWAAVMVLYPLVSVLPQEFVFRVFFFWRYETLIPRPALLIGTNALLFGYSHIIYGNWVAPLLCVLGGVIFARSYLRHHSFLWVVIEHAAYGCLLFTMGLGWFFFFHG